MHWTSVPSLVDFTLEWRDDHATQWTALAGGSSGPRVNINGPARQADVRGIEHRPGPIWFRVTGQTEDGQTATSEARTAPRSPKPAAIGHQHDHVVGYTLAFGTGILANMAGDAVDGAADAWNYSAYVSFCKGDCPGNSNGLVTAKFGSTPSPYGSGGGNYACSESVACLPGASTTANVEHRLGDMTLMLEQPPYQGTGKIGDEQRPFRWTRDERLAGNLTYLDAKPHKEEWRLIDASALHEFGHAIGLPDFSVPHPGVMWKPTAYTTITVADWALVEKIYESHMPNVGW